MKLKSISMNILVLGGTGRTGRVFIQAALAKGHFVSAIIRDKSKATLPGVNYLEGSPTDEKLINDALKGIDAVVVSLNINRTSDSPFAKITSPVTIISDSVNVLVRGMVINGVKRVITVSASGVGDSWKDMPLFVRWFIRSSNIWKAYLDHDRQEKIVRSSGLDWTIVRPVMLNDKEDSAYRAALGKPSGGYISRKGVAKFILDALESGQHINECVTLNA